MIEFLRALFGLNGSSSNRTVIGTSATFDSKELAYMKDSNNRLAALLNLHKKYKGTLHEEKIKTVYEKTKKIHWYLVSKKRIYELELFHIQNTDNFINTFTLVIDVHQRHKESIFTSLSSQQEQAVEVPAITVELKTNRHKGELFEIVERVRNRSKQGQVAYSFETEVPTLTIPEISINTNAIVFYLKEDAWGKQVSNEISFISTPQEKEAFQSYVSARLGIKNIYYVGNARLNLPNSKDFSAKGMVPVFYWKNYSYALTLNDYRIFPVKIIT